MTVKGGGGLFQRENHTIWSNFQAVGENIFPYYVLGKVKIFPGRGGEIFLGSKRSSLRKHKKSNIRQVSKGGHTIISPLKTYCYILFKQQYYEELLSSILKFTKSDFVYTFL